MPGAVTAVVAFMTTVATHSAAALVSVFGISSAAAVGVVNAFAWATNLFLINSAISALSPKPKNGAGRGLEVSVVDSTAEARIVYGTVRTGGINCIPPYTSGNDGRYLHQVLAFASHEITAYCEHLFDDTTLPTPAAVSGASGDGLIVGGKFDDGAWVRGYLGTTSQTVDYILNAAFSAYWTSTARGRGTAYTAYQYDWKDGKKWNGNPAPTAVIAGAKVYDPRKDSTNGGSGSHRYSDATTWEYSNNPALCWANYKISAYGWSATPSTDIDWPAVVTAADYCEGRVDSNDSFGTVTAINNGTNSGSLLYKTAGGGSWATTHYNTTGFSKGAIRAMRVSAAGTTMVGLHTSAADASGTNAAHLFYSYAAGGGNYGIQIYEGGSPVATISATLTAAEATAAALRVDYDGTYVRYYVNDRLYRTKAAATAGQTLYPHVGLIYTGTPDGVYVNVERRYTCNGVLINSPESLRNNDKLLIDAMLGRQRFVNGKWSCFAGSWTAATDTIEKEDWLAIDGIQAVSGRDSGRYNEVHGLYVDPTRNWQRVECYPRRNSTYKSDDADESIALEIEQPLCLHETETQRKAEFVLRQSRNGVRLSGRLPPRFQRLLPLDTVAVTFAELGWASKLFRILGMTLQPDGSVGVTLGEEQSADWTDPVSSDYGTPSTAAIPANNPTKPSSPSNFVVITNSGVIQATWDAPVVKPTGMSYQIWKGADYDTAVANRVMVWEGAANAASFPTNVNSGYYFWVVSHVNSYHSGWAPVSYGTGAAPEALNGAIALLRDADFTNNSLSPNWETGPWATFLPNSGARANAIRITANTSMATSDPNTYALRQISHVAIDARTVSMVLEASYKINSLFNGGGNAGLYVYMGVTDLAGNFADTAGSSLFNNIGGPTPTIHGGLYSIRKTFPHYIQSSNNLKYPYARVAAISVNSGMIDITRFQMYLG